MMQNEHEMELDQLFRAIAQGEMTLEECLEKFPQHQAELTEIFGLADKLQAVPLPAPDPRFRSAARARILNALPRRSPAAPQGWLETIRQGASFFMSKRPALAMALIAALLFSLIGTGTAFASQGAAPGDLLYPVKVQVEDFRLDMAPDGTDEILYRQFAAERVEEVKTLLAQERYDDIPAAVDRLERLLSDAALGSERGPAKNRPEMADGFSNNLTVLMELLDQVPDAAKPGLENAIDRSSRARKKLEDLSLEAVPAPLDEQDLSKDHPNGQPEGTAKDKPEQSPEQNPNQGKDGKPVDGSNGKSSDHPENPGKGKPEKAKPAGGSPEQPGKRPTPKSP